MIALHLGLFALACLVIHFVVPNGRLAFVRGEPRTYESTVDDGGAAWRDAVREARDVLDLINKELAANRIGRSETLMNQRTLHRLGYLKGNPEIVIDGFTGPAYREAMNEFARDIWAKRRARTVPAWRSVR